MVIPRMVASNGEKYSAGVFLSIYQPLTKQSNESPWFENRENLQSSVTNTLN